MPRVVQCAYLKKEAEGLDFPPYPVHTELGKKVWENVSKEAWAAWMKHQTMLVNENRLNLADQRARQYLMRQADQFFFGTAPKRWRAMCRRRPEWGIRCGGRGFRRAITRTAPGGGPAGPPNRTPA